MNQTHHETMVDETVNNKRRRKTVADILVGPRRGTITFELLAEATQKLLDTSNKLLLITSSEFRRMSVPAVELSSTTPSHYPSPNRQCYPPANSSKYTNCSHLIGSGNSLINNSSSGTINNSQNWLLTFADALDPSRDSTIAAVYRLLRAKERIAESYKKIKGAFKKLQDEYVVTKDSMNLIMRYTSMKKMIKEIVTLEKQYWVLIDIPKQEVTETQVDYIVRVLNCLDQRLQVTSAASVAGMQPKMSGIASLFVGSSQLPDRSKDAQLLEQVKAKSTDELRKENVALQNDFYKLLKKYSGLRALATQLRINFEATRFYPIIPRYSMLKNMIQNTVRSPPFMEVCHEHDHF